MHSDPGAQTGGADDGAPLGERITAPDRLDIPDTPGLEWRPASTDDLDILIPLHAAMGRADHPNYLVTGEEIREELEHSWVDPANDTLVGVTPDGVAAAFGQVVLTPAKETVVRSILFGGVHPEFRGRGIGRQLLAWQEGRALQQLATSDLKLPGWILLFTDDRAERTHRLATAAGFRPARFFTGLARDLSQPIPDLPLPEGVTIEPYRPKLSGATLQAKNAAFRDHWGSQPTTQEQWESMLALSFFRPDLSFLALAGDEVVGFLTSEVNEDDWPGQGYSSAYIPLVGVVREWRRKGIAPALLARAFTAFREQGLERAVLDVDSDNPTGALGLYTGMGFVPETRETAFSKVF
ncbi:MAG: GNAT family N-acetyltransferase [Actinomycetota bacterium]|nr:GNAT family N-acetyltransferase [Actinomycetota bacterium]